MSTLLTEEDKQHIAFRIKPITEEMVEQEWNQLCRMIHASNTYNGRCRTGNNVVDFFTYRQRLETKGKYNCSFFEFLEQLEEFKQKHYIKTMLYYYDTVKNKNRTKNEHVVLKEVYNICISAINIMRPLNCAEVYKKYGARRVLNFCAGWGGSTIAAAAVGLEAFYGVDINHALAPCYERMKAFLAPRSTTQIEVVFGDAADPAIDFSRWNYDLVFSSPPYYFVEKYQHMRDYRLSKRQMDAEFYRPVFTKAYAHLKPGGYFVINVCREVYNMVLQPLLGDAQEVMPLKKSKRQNNHQELVCVWRKEEVTPV